MKKREMNKLLRCIGIKRKYKKKVKVKNYVGIVYILLLFLILTFSYYIITIVEWLFTSILNMPFLA